MDDQENGKRNLLTMLLIVVASLVSLMAGFAIGKQSAKDTPEKAEKPGKFETPQKQARSKTVSREPVPPVGNTKAAAVQTISSEIDTVKNQQWQLQQVATQKVAHTYHSFQSEKPYAITVEAMEAKKTETLLFETGKKPPKEPILWDQAKEYLNQEVTVIGTVEAAHNTGKVVFLNFDRNWKGKFHLVLYSSAWKAIEESKGVPAEEFFKLRKIMIQGTVRARNGVPQILVRSADRIELIE